MTDARGQHRVDRELAQRGGVTVRWGVEPRDPSVSQMRVSGLASEEDPSLGALAEVEFAELARDEHGRLAMPAPQLGLRGGVAVVVEEGDVTVGGGPDVERHAIGAA